MQKGKKIKKTSLLKKLNKDIFLRQKLPLNKFIYSSVFLNLLNLGCVFILQRSLPPEVPLFYGLAKGNEQLTTTLGLALPGTISLSITLINAFVSRFLNNEFFQKILILTAFSVSIITLIATFKIIILVGSF